MQNFVENIIKPNPAIYKKDKTLSPGGGLCRNSMLVYIQIKIFLSL